ncbi:MAG: fibronectin type III domain-containing protein, partial [Clostridia bacterium]|nr:fibronectin type III domain-containing protein [Clostridia bacterium]
LLTKGKFCADQLLYTRDNHKTFSSPKVKEFIVTTTKYTVSVTAVCDESCLRAEVRQTVTLYSFKKIIAIKNEILHASDMINDDRYKRYLYYTFPFEVENCKRYCNLNGVVAEYGKDITGHGTDAYMAVRDFACVENAKTGVALFTKDYQLTEFDKIHPDKTEYGILGGGSNIFSYFANDWLQMHSSGGSRQDYRLEYAITSYIGDYKAAGVPRLAEEFVTPLQTVNTSENKGVLGENITFIAFDTFARFIGLKRADDGKGFIARFLSDGEKINFGGIRAERVTIDERSVIENKYTRGFISYRLFGDKIFPKTKKADEPVAVGGAPLPIGSVYTGLIDKPRAGTGEGSGKIYLLWGASKEEDFSHYELYRSKVSGFALSEENLIAEVYPEEFVVGRYEDCGLEDNTEYFYRVRAVNKKGVKGEASEEFGAFTREPLEKKR